MCRCDMSSFIYVLYILCMSSFIYVLYILYMSSFPKYKCYGYQEAVKPLLPGGNKKVMHT